MPKERSKDRSQDKRIRKLEKLVATVEEKYDIFSTYNATDGIVMPLPTTGPAPRKMIDIPQGDAVNSRAGNKIQINRLTFIAQIANTSAAPQSYRLTIFKWNSDAVPVYTDVYAAPVAGTGVPDPTLYAENPVLKQSKILQIKYDKIFWLGGTAPALDDRLITIKKTFKDSKPMYFFDSASSDYTKGWYYLLTASNVLNQCSDRMECFYTDL